ncbi:MAG TPA: BlaI/MecI/CopY family transcriptional regulator [Candidatus Acidoferrales bacterium]|nr:BlaI/MecI/CopY family transcriptional regulator [Candidatus Acidoferrales bacterium]
MNKEVASTGGDGRAARRRSLLELAPLELDCMSALWLLNQGTVREIRDVLAPRRPRAYTTIMTIMDRLAHKGIVERRRVGRAWMYSANLSKDEARAHAVKQVVDSFFGGSTDALLAQISSAPRARSAADEPASAASVAAEAGERSN